MKGITSDGQIVENQAENGKINGRCRTIGSDGCHTEALMKANKLVGVAIQYDPDDSELGRKDFGGL